MIVEKFTIIDWLGGIVVNICIVGGGNIGTLLAGELSLHDSVSVRILTTRPHLWQNKIEIICVQSSNVSKGSIDLITNDPKSAVWDADLILLTVPSNIIEKEIEKISPYVKSGAYVGAVPGTGGVEFHISKLLNRNCVFFGLQRVHSIARLKEYGKSVYMTGRKKEIHVASIPSNKVTNVCKMLEELLNIKCHPLNNYLNVTLTPSNALLHTTRIYSIFRDYQSGLVWPENILFYEEWDHDSSRLLLACDDELQKMCKSLEDINLSAVKPLRIHYESETYKELTLKLRSISAFKNIYAPMLKVQSGYIPDFNSRYFIEDFSFGLCIIKEFCSVLNIETPSMDKLLSWYGKVLKHLNIRHNKQEASLTIETSFLKKAGLNNRRSIYNFYLSS